VTLIACEFCDSLHRERALAHGERAVCSSCGGLLYRAIGDSLRRTLVFALTALILFAIANLTTFMFFSLEGQSQQNTIFAGVEGLWNGGAQALALLIGLTTMVAPALALLTILYVTAPLTLGWKPPAVSAALRFWRGIGTWSMLDVYALAVIVSVVKLAMMARVEMREGAYAFVAMMVMMTAASASLDPRAIWRRIEELD
jgi:paraquat-inducible protein A